MTDRIPFLLFGDGPRIPTGLARIARDLMARLVAEQEDLGIRVAQVGIDPVNGWQWRKWDFYGFQPNLRDQGRTAVGTAAATLQQECGGRQPIVLMLMDPARCYDLTRYEEDEQGVGSALDIACWGYFPVDSENLHAAVGGPAAVCVRSVDRCLAYGRYGAGVLSRTRNPGRDPLPLVASLPHGLNTQAFRPTPTTAADVDFLAWARAVPSDAIRIGCVATNQPRKDFGLLCTTLQELKRNGREVACWLHTDLLTKAWDVGELVTTCGLRRHEIAVSTAEITDTQLAAQYSWSDVTIAPGLGEGFGYPIVESLACGTPVIHGNYAGGVELIPNPDWLVEPVAWRLESVYALLRPVFSPKDFAVATLAAVDQMRAHPVETRAYCTGAVSYLDWECMWPHWKTWIQKGLADHGQK